MLGCTHTNRSEHIKEHSMSPILFWILVALFGIGPVLTMGRIGKPRGPATPADAIVSTLVNVALIISLFIWGR